MALILDGKQENVPHKYIKIIICQEKKIRSLTALDQNKRLKQIKKPKYLHTCAPLCDLPSVISSMM